MVRCERHNYLFLGSSRPLCLVSFPPSALLFRCLPVSRSFSVSGRPCLYSYPAFPLYTPFLRNKEVVVFLVHGVTPVSFLLAAGSQPMMVLPLFLVFILSWCAAVYFFFFLLTTVRKNKLQLKIQPLQCARGCFCNTKVY